MGDTTTHGAPFPIGTDRVMDGDNAIQALAEWVDAALWTNPDPDALAPGVWKAAGSVICTDGTLAAQPGTTVYSARFTRVGNTVWFQGEGAMVNAITNVAISLPNALAGVPHHRVLGPGTCLVVDTAGAPVQTGACIMHVSKDRLMPITSTGAYVDAPATSGIRWSVAYEVLPS